MRGVPAAVWLSHRTVAGTIRLVAGTPDLSSLPAIEGRSKDIVRCGSRPRLLRSRDVELVMLEVAAAFAWRR